ncbi:MAG: type I methionyl aminopeptidase [Thermodesulfovibrionales bacterium]
MIFLKSPDEIEKMTRPCRIVGTVLDELKGVICPGVSTKEIEELADSRIRALGGRPAFKGYRGYPASICASVNEEVVHGIPSSRKLREGDTVGIDIGVFAEGFYGDAAYTFAVGTINAAARKLLSVTEESLYRGIEQAVEGNRVNDISHAIQSHVERNGFSVVRTFVGHGIGRELHEEPQVPNYGLPGRGPRLREGMTLAIEPMVNEGGPDVIVLEDGWTTVTADRRRSAHYEHTVLVTAKGPRILTKSEV